MSGRLLFPIECQLRFTNCFLYLKKDFSLYNNLKNFSASVRDADVLVEKNRQRNLSPHTTSTMEHRTLKQRENVLTGRRSPTSTSAREQHMRSLHELVQSIEGFQADKSRNSTITLNSTRGVVSQDCGGSDLELPPPAKIMPFSGMKPQASFFEFTRFALWFISHC